jgi:acetyl-CoA C-acetyltransferase
MDLEQVVIAGACRTAIGKFLGGLKDVPARDLAMTAGAEAIKRAGIEPDVIDEICLGQVYGGMQGSLPARQVGIRIGLPAKGSAVNVNQNCASGMRALEIAAHNIMLGNTAVSLAIGVENMSAAPYLLPQGRTGYRLNAGTIEDHMIHDGLYDELAGGHMGVTAENVAEKYGITREECDQLALLSHTRAVEAIESGRFQREIVPVEVRGRKKTVCFDMDEHPLRGANLEDMAKLPPVFKKGGVVTAANASGINDGAAAVVLMSRTKARELGVEPRLLLLDICDAGVDPKLMGLGPAKTIPRGLRRAGLEFEDIDYWEINEAFAAQWLGVGRMLEEESGIRLDLDKVNHNGSGIALGHPVGCTGVRLVVTLLHELERLDLTLGGATLCVGTGPAVGSLWTREI